MCDAGSGSHVLALPCLGNCMVVSGEKKVSGKPIVMVGMLPEGSSVESVVGLMNDVGVMSVIESVG